MADKGKYPKLPSELPEPDPTKSSLWIPGKKIHKVQRRTPDYSKLPPPVSPEEAQRLFEDAKRQLEGYEKVPFQPVIPERPKRPDDELSDIEHEELMGALYELHSRQNEALNLFEPTPIQEAFFRSESPERVIIGGNRSGKSTATLIEVARACTGADPYGKYPKRDGRIFAVGPSLKHLGLVLYKKLFLPGSFLIIRDLDTGNWRTYRPNDPADSSRLDEVKKAPPLIPKRFYTRKDVSWKVAGDQQPLSVRISKTGWELHFYSFASPPPRGVDIDICLFDEDAASGEWYTEMSARLLDRRLKNSRTGKIQSGRLIWSLTPQNCSSTSFDLCRRGEEYAELKEPEDKASSPVEVFTLDLMDNPHISEESKREFIEKFSKDQETLDVRVHGRFALYGTRVYGEFTPRGAHGCESFVIGEDWTRYVAIDPGVQVCAVLFAAIPPPRSSHDGQIVIYDELYLKRSNAKVFAEEFKRKVGSQQIQAGIIDFHCGRIHEIGSGLTHAEQYTRELKAVGFEFANGGANFVWSTDDVKAGVQEVKNSMHIIGGRSQLLVFRDKVPNLLHEMERYSNRKLPDGTVTDDPIQKGNHACFSAGTLIETDQGQIPIEEIEVGDSVLTRSGFRRVTDFAMTSEEAEVVEVEFSGGQKLVGTPNHPIASLRIGGYTPISELRIGEYVYGVPKWEGADQGCEAKLSFTRVSSSTDSSFPNSGAEGTISRPPILTGLRVFRDFTRRFGKTISAQYQKDTTSTTRMATHSTTISRIWNAFQPKLTTSIMSRIVQRYRKSQQLAGSLDIEKSPQIGILPKREKSGILRILKRCGKRRSPFNTHARTADQIISRQDLMEIDSARLIVERRPGESLELITKQGYASDAGNSFLSTSMLGKGFARLIVQENFQLNKHANFAENSFYQKTESQKDFVLFRVQRVSGKKPKRKVFNLTVETDHEYVANGIVVGNCDCLRYLISGQLRYIRPKKQKRTKGYTIKALEAKREREKARMKRDNEYSGSYNVG